MITEETPHFNCFVTNIALLLAFLKPLNKCSFMFRKRNTDCSSLAQIQKECSHIWNVESRDSGGGVEVWKCFVAWWSCTCLLPGGTAVCCPVETGSCRLLIHRPLGSETVSQRSAGGNKHRLIPSHQAKVGRSGISVALPGQESTSAVIHGSPQITSCF